MNIFNDFSFLKYKCTDFFLSNCKPSWASYSGYNRSKVEDSWIKYENLLEKIATTQMIPATTEPLNTTTPVPETPIPIILKKSFKKYPQWDFEDIYNQDAPPRPSVSYFKT